MNQFAALKTAVLIGGLLSLSPVFLLLKHHEIGDILDKILLFLTAFGIAYLNIQFQNYLFLKKISLFKTIFNLFIFNILLLSADLFLRIMVFNVFTFQAPPLVILILTESIRNITIALSVFFIMKYLFKSRSESDKMLKIKELENESLELQLKGLSAQLQPHFFFNCLNVLSELIQTDILKSEEYIQQLSHFFRYILSAQQKTLVPLSDELKFMDTYWFLLKIRFGENMQIQNDTAKNQNFLIPSLSTLVLMENIVKHNNINKVKIWVEIDAENQCLRVKNSKNLKNKLQGNSLGYGLKNSDKKCHLLLRRGLKIKDSEGEFEAEIPLLSV